MTKGKYEFVTLKKHTTKCYFLFLFFTNTLFETNKIFIFINIFIGLNRNQILKWQQWQKCNTNKIKEKRLELPNNAIFIGGIRAQIFSRRICTCDLRTKNILI